MNTRTNIVIDDQLIAKAMARAGVKTKKAAVEAALRAYVRKPDYTGLLALAGSGVLADDYDPKTLFTGLHDKAPHLVMEPVASYGAPESTGARKKVGTRAPKGAATTGVRRAPKRPA